MSFSSLITSESASVPVDNIDSSKWVLFLFGFWPALRRTEISEDKRPCAAGVEAEPLSLPPSDERSRLRRSRDSDPERSYHCTVVSACEDCLNVG